jgi:hypothetical protein
MGPHRTAPTSAHLPHIQPPPINEKNQSPEGEEYPPAQSRQAFKLKAWDRDTDEDEANKRPRHPQGDANPQAPLSRGYRPT